MNGPLALICAGCETYFYIGVSKEVGANAGRITLGILIFSAGMFVSSTALLPSTTSMYLCMLSHGAWFQQNYKLAIFFTALSTFVRYVYQKYPIIIYILCKDWEINKVVKVWSWPFYDPFW